MLRSIFLKSGFDTKAFKVKRVSGRRCNGGIEKPEVSAKMTRELRIQGISLPLFLTNKQAQNGSFEPVCL